jgi:hypothetical protein
MKDMEDDLVQSLQRLRVLVAVVGGATHAKWWRTEFLTVAGLRFLERLYPRTRNSAAIQATAVAARLLHDSSIGRGGVYHLFRLPESIEGQLHAHAARGALTQIVRDLEPSLERSDAMLAQFEASPLELTEGAPGPQRIGTLRELRRGSQVVAKWAGAYLHAFRNEYKVFPYVEAEKSL